MASSKKTSDEKVKKRSKLSKQESNKKKNKKTPKNNASRINGAVKKTQEVIAVSSSSSDDSPQQQEPESVQDSDQINEDIAEETSKPRSKTKNTKKSKKVAEEDADNDDDDEKAGRFPTRRIWRIAKSHTSDSSIAGDAVFLINKATEKFIEQFSEDGYAQCVKDRKKSLSYQHLASVVSKQRRYDFLSDFVPEKMKAETALAESKLIEQGDDGGV